MSGNRARRAVILIALALAACGRSGEQEEARRAEVFAHIGESETIHLVGTEPFWGGEISGDVLTYSTPENIDGAELPVERFAGFNGLGFSGELDGAWLDLAITLGDCSDGMSDRSYPFVVTLRIGEEQRDGCAWTAAMPYSEARGEAAGEASGKATGEATGAAGSQSGDGA